jgi:DNA-binding NtrC family response regulator
VKFVGVGEAQQKALREILAADHTQAIGGRRAMIVEHGDVKSRALSSELVALGFNVRRESSPERAAAWLQREETEVVLVGERMVSAHRWSLLEFVRETAPEIRRFVLANDVRSFRLYYAMKAGLVEGLIPPDTASEALARYLLGSTPDTESKPCRQNGRRAAPAGASAAAPPASAEPVRSRRRSVRHLSPVLE